MFMPRAGQFFFLVSTDTQRKHSFDERKRIHFVPINQWQFIIRVVL